MYIVQTFLYVVTLQSILLGITTVANHVSRASPELRLWNGKDKVRCLLWQTIGAQYSRVQRIRQS